jgi:hypothetical protein
MKKTSTAEIRSIQAVARAMWTTAIALVMKKTKTPKKKNDVQKMHNTSVARQWPVSLPDHTMG